MKPKKERETPKGLAVTIVAVSVAILLIAAIAYFTVNIVLRNDNPGDESSESLSESTTQAVESSESAVEGPDNETDIDDLLGGI